MELCWARVGPRLPLPAALGGLDVPRGDQLHGPEGGPQGLWLGGALPLEGGDLQQS